MSKSRLTRGDIRLVRQFLLEMAPTCLHKPEGLLKNRFVTPTYNVTAGGDDSAVLSERSLFGHYLQMYDWDALLFSQAAFRLGIDGLPFCVVANFLSLQEASGYIPRTISPNQIWDGGDLCKPFLAQVLVAELERTSDARIDEAATLLDGIERHLQYFQEHRRHESGLYFWRNVLESGVDNNMALLAPVEALKDEDQSIVSFPDGRLLATDLNSYLFAEFKAFSKLLEKCGDARAQHYRELARELAEKVEERLWDQSLGLYVNVDPQTGDKVLIRAWTGLAPVLFGIASAQRTKRLIETNIMNPEHFLQRFGVASMAVSELLSNQSPRGLYGRAIVCNWQGPVWILPNVFVVRKLIDLGLHSEALDVANRVVSVMLKDIKENGILHENYDANTGQPLWAPNFMSWNVLALELLEVLETSRRGLLKGKINHKRRLGCQRGNAK